MLPLLGRATAASTACRRRGRVPPLLVLAASTPARCSAGTTRRTSSFEPAARAAQRRRAALGGVRPARRSGCSAISRRRSRHLALVNSAFNLAPHLPSPMHRRHADSSARDCHNSARLDSGSTHCAVARGESVDKATALPSAARIGHVLWPSQSQSHPAVRQPQRTLIRVTAAATASRPVVDRHLPDRASSTAPQSSVSASERPRSSARSRASMRPPRLLRRHGSERAERASRARASSVSDASGGAGGGGAEGTRNGTRGHRPRIRDRGIERGCQRPELGSRPPARARRRRSGARRATSRASTSASSKRRVLIESMRLSAETARFAVVLRQRGGDCSRAPAARSSRRCCDCRRTSRSGSIGKRICVRFRIAIAPPISESMRRCSARIDEGRSERCRAEADRGQGP